VRNQILAFLAAVALIGSIVEVPEAVVGLRQNKMHCLAQAGQLGA
jgi:hypothetical protein